MAARLYSSGLQATNEHAQRVGGRKLSELHVHDAVAGMGLKRAFSIQLQPRFAMNLRDRTGSHVALTIRAGSPAAGKFGQPRPKLRRRPRLRSTRDLRRTPGRAIRAIVVPSPFDLRLCPFESDGQPGAGSARWHRTEHGITLPCGACQEFDRRRRRRRFDQVRQSTALPPSNSLDVASHESGRLGHAGEASASLA